jgi:hypothetical protein
MFNSNNVSRRQFVRGTLAAVAVAGIESRTMPNADAAPTGAPKKDATVNAMPCGKIGNATISRLLLGGNLIAGNMHARDLKYVGQLFKAYATEEKMMETLRLAEEHGINTVFESGAWYIQKYNREYDGKMQFIPHIKVDPSQSPVELETHIQRQVDSGAVALYVWGVAADRLVQAGAVDQIARAVELAKYHDLPVGVGSHSLLVPMACEKHGIPCDFYVKTLHRDDYPSATPEELRKEFIWLDGGKGWYDNMWCINPEETVAFMQTVKKPWIAFKVLAAGAYRPQQGFKYAFESGADFIAVGMLDFQIKEDCELALKFVRDTQQRRRPWRA